MLSIFRRKPRDARFNREVLKKNDISLLILDERWNSIFSTIKKTPGLVEREEKLKELLKEQSRLITEEKGISSAKKEYMDRILKLTTEAFSNGSEEARNEMKACEKEIVRINERIESIRKELDKIPELIREKNIELLEHSVNLVYHGIRQNQKRIGELEQLIGETREKLKEYIDEKELLSQSDSDIYTYLHELLGADELEKLDREFLK